MYKIKLNKMEIGCLFLASALIPVMSLILGLNMSGNLNSSRSIELEQPVITDSETLNSNIQAKSDTTTSNEMIVISTDNEKTIIDSPQYEAELLVSVSQYEVQAGVFSDISNAILYQDHLISIGIYNQIIAEPVEDNKFMYRVVLGSFKSKPQAIKYIMSSEQYQNIELYIKNLLNLYTETTSLHPTNIIVGSI